MRERLLRLVPEIDLIKDETLREKVISTWIQALEKGGWEPEEMCKIPFTLLIDGSEVSFLDHVRAVTKMVKAALDISKEFYGNKLSINEDLLIAGALLHDVGKLIEYELKGGEYVQTKIGKTLRHPFIGAALAYLSGLPPEISHIIAFHSHEGDHIKRSLEAILVNKIDLLNFELFKAKGEVISSGQDNNRENSFKQTRQGG
ncbi:MAG: HD domain-containing protein [Synergistetes bacterium]|nr:HD domain-containing protein [Synergistota bacterium]MCX8127273.1 HD domain-containing protein [Synergistota bacterium]MDW8191841.1 HD domain-containing protein [Synergistota bacterium]